MILGTEKAFLKKIEEEINIFQNFKVIMEKALKDGYISQIFKTIKNIFHEELNFAFFGILKRIK